MKQTANRITLFVVIIACSVIGIITLVSADGTVGSAKLNDAGTEQILSSKVDKLVSTPTVDPGNPDSTKAY